MKQIALLIALTLPFALTACGGSDDSKSSAKTAYVSDTLRKGNGAEPATMDPHRAQGVTASNILRDLIEGLVSEAADGELIPGAAKSWTVNEDGTVYVFELRENGRWSNGDPVTADDFVFSLRRAVDPATGSNYAQILAPINNAEAIIEGTLPPSRLGVKALSPQQLEITLKGPTPYFLGLLTHSTSHPVHPASVQAHGDAFVRPGNFVSNGAYVLSEWQVQSHIKLTPNTHYWDAANRQVDNVLYYPIEDAESELKRYRADELDWTGTIPLSKCQWVKDNMGDDLKVHPYLGTYYYGLNNQKAPLNNPQVREALSLGLDRQKLIEKFTRCSEIPAYGWVPPNINNYSQQTPEYAAWTQAERNKKALSLLNAAGYNAENPLSFELLYNTSEGHKKIALAIANIWQQALPINVTLTNQEWKVYLDTRSQGNTQVYRAGWIGDYNDANTFLEIFHSKHGMNDVGYSNPEYDALLDAASTETDEDKRRSMLEQAEGILLNDHALLPIYFYVSKSLVKPWVKNYQGNIMDHHYSKRLAVP